MTCQPLILGYDANSRPPGYIARCACGWKSGAENSIATAHLVMRWHLDGESPTVTAVNRLGLVLVRRVGGKSVHAAKWLQDSTVCGKPLRTMRSWQWGDVSCEDCLKWIAARTDSKV